jgi:hypothetical protein
VRLEAAVDDYKVDALRRLIQGARGSGVTLSAQECELLLAILRPEPKGRGHPPSDFGRIIDMATDSIFREAAGASVKAAVEATGRAFKVKRSTVFAARRAMKSK